MSLKHKENETFQFIPDIEHDQDWAIRILEGPYNETVIKFGSIEANGEGEDTYLSFNFFIKESPDTELTEEDEGLQEEAGAILQECLRVAVTDGSLQMSEKTE